MKYIVVFFILCILFSSCSMQLNNAPTQSYYVSPSGDDGNDGSIEHPVSTFEAAKKIVRKFRKSNPYTSVTVYFRGGKYYLTKPVVFSSKDNGSEKAPVIYKAYPDEVPFIIGGKKLNLEWEPFKDGIYKAKVPEGVVFESLFVNGKQQVLARYPNYNPNAGIFNGTAADCISPERVKTWKSPKGGYFHVMHAYHWGSYHYQILGKKNDGELEMTGGWQTNRPEGGLDPELRYVENIFEELDTLNEWYLDREESMLYFYPDPSIDLGKVDFEYASLENLIQFVGTEEKPVRYITLEGFNFMRTVRTFLKNKEPLLRSDWTIYRGGSVFFQGTENCAIKNCTFNQIGGNAIFFNNYNKNCLVYGCLIHNIGANAICFVGDTLAVRNAKYVPYGPYVTMEEMDLTPGPKNNNYPNYCVVDNNLIYDIGLVEKQVAGVEISISGNITVRHNSIYNVPRAGINIGEGAFGGHLIEFNDVFKTVLETGDHGSFNSWGRDRFWTPDKTKTEMRVKKNPSIILLDMLAPNVIRNNRFRCDHGWDIDLDDGSSYYEIYNNLCLKGGIKLREGYYRQVENNICVNNALHPHVWFKNSGDIVRGNIFSAVYQPVYVDYWGKEVDYNWFVYQNDLKKVHQLGIEKNSLSGDPLFIDPVNGDFSVSNGSGVYTLGWKNFPMNQFGVQLPALKSIAETPEIPKLEPMNFMIDNVVLFYSGQIKNLTTDGELSATGMSEKTGVLVLYPPRDGVFKTIILRPNDVILKVNGETVKNVTELRSILSNNQIKTITIWRNQNELRIKK